MENLTSIYEYHHSHHREVGFSILAKERGELFKKWIGTGKRVLDIGCRDGALTKYVLEGNHVIGIDVDQEALKRAQEQLGIETKKLDILTEWPFTEKFDAVMAGEILEHLYYPDRIVQKIYNNLTPGGLFIGSVPNAFSLKNRLRYLRGSTKNTPLADPTHINQFSYSSLKDLLESQFASVEIIGLGKFGFLSHHFPSLVSFDFAFKALKL